MAATASKSRWSSASGRRAPTAVTATAADGRPAEPAARLRLVLPPHRLRALADAIERGAAIELEARVVAGDTLLDAGATVVLELDAAAAPVRGDGLAIEPFTPREREVLELVAEGMSNRAIADRLGVSEHTVKFHVGSLLGKLSAATRAELVAVALRRGLILL